MTRALSHVHFPEQALTSYYSCATKALDNYLALPLLQAGIDLVQLDLGGDWVPRVINAASENYFWNAMNNLDMCLYQQEQGSEHFVIATTKKQLEEAQQNNQVALVLCLGGGRPLEGKPNLNVLSNLRLFHRLGVRVVQIAGYGRNRLADGVAEARTKGQLSYFGEEVIAEMDRLGMLIDTAAINDEGFAHIMKLTQSPLLNSRANCAALSSHPLNLTDERIKQIAATKGVIGLSFYADLLAKDKLSPGAEDLIAHIEHLAEIGGIDCVGLGGDIAGLASKTPTRYERHPGLVNGLTFTERANDYGIGLDSWQNLVVIADRLGQKNYKDEQIQAIMGGNLRRLYQQIL